MNINIVFNRKSKLNSKGEGIVEIQVYFDRYKRFHKSTGVKVEPKFWNDKKKIVLSKHPSANFLNAQISKYRHEVEKLITAQQFQNNGEIDLSQLEKDAPKKVETFYAFFQRHIINTVNVSFSEPTIRYYERTLRYLKQYHPTDISFDKLTVNFFQDFDRFLVEERKLAQNSRATIFKKVKKIVGQAEVNDLLLPSKNPFKRGFNVKEIAPEKESLTLEELRKIENINIEFRPELDKTRDMFLFSCYTGLRYSDLINLSFENFTILKDGKIRLSYIAQKTSHHSRKRIEWIVSDFWNGRIDSIIKKKILLYDHARNQPKEQRLFFKYSNAVYNRNLKELQRFAGIDTKLTSHLARHTCITLLINDFAMDITKVQMVAGHSKIEMTRSYLRITEQDLATAAQRVNWDV